MTPIEASISVVSSERASNSLYTCLKLSKLSFISLTGMSSMNSDADRSRDAKAFPLVFWPIPLVGARLFMDPGTAYGPPLIGDFLAFVPAVVAIGDFGLCMAFDAAVYFK